MTNKHMQGPWELTEASASIPIKGANGKTVCSIAFRDNDLDDARLIAAAPELLREAEWALDILTVQFGLDDECEGIVALRAAIAKARGEV